MPDIYTIATMPQTWIGRRIIYGHQRRIGRLDGVIEISGRYRLALTTRRGRIQTAALPADTQVRLYDQEDS